jgi:hypothetical protein
LLALITILLAGAVTASVGVGSISQSGPNFASISAEASPDGTVTLTHEYGEAVDVTDVTVIVSVDGTRLSHQPPVPFFSAAGFAPGPTGPFNTAADSNWTVGERASFVISETNSPTPTAGDQITVEILEGGTKVAVVETTVSPGG